MSLRSLRYIIYPPSGCPPNLLKSNGHPMESISFETGDVSNCARGEILQTAPRGASLVGFFEDLLSPGNQLIWRGGGPGRGTEMRRSFSGLFGRFFARAYLQVNHGFVWFAAIDGDEFHISAKWRIKKKRSSKAELPDWICARPGELAIAEAKGSHIKASSTRGGTPGPIRTALGQIAGVHVQKHIAGTTWRNKSVKGWAVMSRWGLEHPPREPYIYVLDPKTDGEELNRDESVELEQAIARVHVMQTLEALQPSEKTAAASLPRRVRIRGDVRKRTFLGLAVTPFGPLSVEIGQFSEISKYLDSPNLIRFVGLDEDLIAAYLQGLPLYPRQQERLDGGTYFGQDGLLVTSVNQLEEDVS